MFSCKFCEIFKNIFVYRTLPVAACVSYELFGCVCLFIIQWCALSKMYIFIIIFVISVIFVITKIIQLTLTIKTCISNTNHVYRLKQLLLTKTLINVKEAIKPCCFVRRFLQFLNKNEIYEPISNETKSVNVSFT